MWLSADADLGQSVMYAIARVRTIRVARCLAVSAVAAGLLRERRLFLGALAIPVPVLKCDGGEGVHLPWFPDQKVLDVWSVQPSREDSKASSNPGWWTNGVGSPSWPFGSRGARTGPRNRRRVPTG